MNKFNEICKSLSASILGIKGNFVECMHTHCDVTKGRVYEVVKNSYEEGYIWVKDDVGDRYDYAANRFRLKQ